MAQSMSPSSKLPYLSPDDKAGGDASPRQQGLLGRVKDNLDLKKHLGFTSDQNTTAANAAVASGTEGSESVSTQTPQQLDSEAHAPNPDDLLSGEGKSWSRWAVDQVKYVADGVASKSLSDELLPKDPTTGDAKSWSQWATENAIAAKDVAASKLPSTNASDYDAVGGEKKSVSQTLVDTGMGFKDTIANKLGYAADQSSRSAADMKFSVQDVLDRHSTTTRTPEVGQVSVTKALIDTGLGLKDGIATQLGYGPNPDTPAAARAAMIKEQTANRAAALRQSTMARLAPGNGEKDLSKSITGTLTSLPTLLKEKVWVSNSSETAISPDRVPRSTISDDSTTAASGGLVNRVAGVVSSATGVVSSATGVVSSYLPTSVASYLPGHKSPEDVDHANLEPTSDSSTTTEVTFEEKLDQVGPEKLMELWTIGNGTLDWTVNSGTDDPESCLSPKSPKTQKSIFSADVKHRNLKAEAISEAHRTRVTTEANAYMDAELRKAEAHAQKMHANAEKHRIHDEVKAAEALKKETLRAALLVHNAEVKVEKLLAQAKSRALSIEAAATEQYAHNTADAKTKAERWEAEVEEVKQTEIADVRQRVEEMIMTGELPEPPEHKGVVKKVKDELVHSIKERIICHGGY